MYPNRMSFEEASRIGPALVACAMQRGEISLRSEPQLTYWQAVKQKTEARRAAARAERLKRLHILSPA